MVDTNFFVIVDKKASRRNEKLRMIVQNMPKIDLNSYMPKVDMSQYVKLTPDQQKILEEKKEPSETQEIRIGQIKMTQYTMNTLNNPYDVPLEVVGIATIPPRALKHLKLAVSLLLLLRSAQAVRQSNCHPIRNLKSASKE